MFISNNIIDNVIGDIINKSLFPTEWSPRSPDLTPYDFILWGYLKSKVPSHHLKK